MWLFHKAAGSQVLLGTMPVRPTERSVESFPNTGNVHISGKERTHRLSRSGKGGAAARDHHGPSMRHSTLMRRTKERLFPTRSTAGGEPKPLLLIHVLRPKVRNGMGSLTGSSDRTWTQLPGVRRLQRRHASRLWDQPCGTAQQKAGKRKRRTLATMKWIDDLWAEIPDKTRIAPAPFVDMTKHMPLDLFAGFTISRVDAF